MNTHALQGNTTKKQDTPQTQHVSPVPPFTTALKARCILSAAHQDTSVQKAQGTTPQTLAQRESSLDFNRSLQLENAEIVQKDSIAQVDRLFPQDAHSACTWMQRTLK